jgi:hypothetical protein
MNGECAGRANSGLRPALKKTMTAADAFYPGLCVVAKADEEREETSEAKLLIIYSIADQ